MDVVAVRALELSSTLKIYLTGECPFITYIISLSFAATFNGSSPLAKIGAASIVEISGGLSVRVELFLSSTFGTLEIVSILSGSFAEDILNRSEFEKYCV
jgi:hypothetical protein